MVWALRQYTLPLLLALAVHAAVGVWLVRTFDPARTDPLDAYKPKMVHSKLIVLEPKAAAKPPPKAVPTPRPEPRPEPRKEEPAKPDPALEAARKKAEQEEAARLQAAREQAEAQARAEEQARQERLAALADAAFLNSLADESEHLAEGAAAADAEEVAQSYRYGIYQKVVANWSRPPSARNGMQARLQVELVPTGDVVAVMLLESSGNAAFDHSAEAAVKKARRFEVPKDSAIFERYFRRFTLLFRPEDLLR